LDRRVLFFYDDDIDVRFPAHYRKPLFEELPGRYGIPTDIICFRSSIRETLFERRPHGMAVYIPKIRPKRMIDILREFRRTSRAAESALRQILDGSGTTPTHIVAFNYPPFLRLAERWSRKLGAKFIAHIGFLAPEELLTRSSLIDWIRGFGGRIMRNRMLGRADQVWAMSEAMRDLFVRDFGLPPRKVKAWPSAVESVELPASFAVRRNELRNALGLRDDDLALVYIGSLSRFRGLDFLIDALKRLIAKPGMDRVRMVFIGYSLDGADIKFLRDYAEAAGLADRVRIHESVPEDELPFYIRACDIGLSPIEPNGVLLYSSPIKILEYFKAGVPVAATRIPDQEDILSRSSGGVLAGWDVPEFAERLKDLCLMTAEERKAMGRRGYEWLIKNREVSILTEEMVRWLGEE